MRHALRVFLVGLVIVAMAFHPAAAWHWGCGGCGSDGGYYYDSGYCGYETVACYGYGGCDSYADCGSYGCDSCDDGSCEGDSCDGCDSCGGVEVESAPVETVHEPAPDAPVEHPAPADERYAPATPPQQPATVDRPVETTPPPVPPSLPADEPDGLFNGTEEAAPPATEPAATTPPATEPAAPVPPSTETPPAETEDIFGAPEETTPPVESMPAEEPAADEPIDLFDEPAATEPEAPAATEPPATDEAPAEEPATEDEDDIFGATRNILREAGGLASEDMRLWIDDTGNYSCRGRLVALLDSHVRLLKDNGRTTTVPLHRLSANDLEFVHRQASAQEAGTYQTAQTLTGVSRLAN